MWGGRIGALRPDPDEVEAVYRVPLSDLEQPGVPQLEQIAESDRPVLSIPFESLNQSVFAPTAAMLYQFREVALHGRHTSVVDYDQPVFAWRRGEVRVDGGSPRAPPSTSPITLRCGASRRLRPTWTCAR